MKRVILNGNMVVNVEAVSDDETDGMIVADDLWVGPGTIWDGDTEAPKFAPAVELSPEG